MHSYVTIPILAPIMNKTIYINVKAEDALKKIRVSRPDFNISRFLSVKLIDTAKKIKVK